MEGRIGCSVTGNLSLSFYSICKGIFRENLFQNEVVIWKGKYFIPLDTVFLRNKNESDLSHHLRLLYWIQFFIFVFEIGNNEDSDVFS